MDVTRGSDPSNSIARARDIDAFDARVENVAKCEFVRQAKEIPTEELRFHETNLYDMEKRFGPYDVVLGLGFMYHLSDPIEISRQLAAVTRDVCVVDSNVNTHPRSVCIYRTQDPHLRHSGIETSVVVPNRRALIKMLHLGDFSIAPQVEPQAWAPLRYREGRRILLPAFKGDGPDSASRAF